MSNETIRHIATVFPIDAEILKRDLKYRRRVSIIKEFSLNTSTHGIPGIARSQSILNRIFWTISFLCFTGAMMYFIVTAIRAYFQYPSQTSVSIIVEWPQAFPAVTICNYSPLRYDQFIGPFLNYTNKTNFTSGQALYIRDFLIYKLNRKESIDDYLYPLDSLMMYCNYNGIPCSSVNFTSFISSMYGACYTFNARLKDTADGGIRYNADNGGSGLLQLRLFTYQYQYIPYLTYASGMVALVHDNTRVPYIELAGMYLAPGQHHKLSYTKKESSFLGAPYTTCNDQVNAGTQLIYERYNGTDYGYAQYYCFLACTQVYVYQKCGCGNPYRWIARSIILPGTNTPIDIPLCEINNPCYGTATSEIMNTQSIRSGFCPDCTQECSTNDFIIKSSSLLTPLPFLMNDIKQFVESSNITLPINWSSTWSSEIQSSYLSLEVAYEITQTEVYSEQPRITAVDVISNVGGQTGLWIGISFLSIMEFVEIIYRLLRYQCHTLRKKVRKYEVTE